MGLVLVISMAMRHVREPRILLSWVNIHLQTRSLLWLLLSTGEVLLQLIVAAATFEPFKQVLAVCVLNYGSLMVYASHTLEDATAGTAIFIHIDYRVSLCNMITLNTCCVFTSLFAGNHVRYRL